MALISNGTTVASGGAIIGAGGTHVKITDFSTTGNVTLSNIFTSTYERYFISIKQFDGSGSGTIRYRFLTSGTTQETGYEYYGTRGRAGASDENTDVSADYFWPTSQNFGNGGSMNIWVSHPQNSGIYSRVHATYSIPNGSTTATRNWMFGGYYNQNKTHTGFYIQKNTGTIEGTVYGISE